MLDYDRSGEYTITNVLHASDKSTSISANIPSSLTVASSLIQPNESSKIITSTITSSSLTSDAK